VEGVIVVLLRIVGLILMVVTASALSPVVAEAASFASIGNLGRSPTNALDISDDGTTVVGQGASVPGNQAFRWNVAIAGLGDFAGGAYVSRANGTNADGSVVVGAGNNADFRNEAFIWTQSSGLVGLGFLSGSTGSTANDVSADGTRVVGGTTIGRLEAFVWDATNGMVGLGDLAGGTLNSQAMDISADGLTIVGNGTSGSGSEAFIWDSTNGMQGLGDLAGGTFSSIASAVSADGSVVVGRGASDAGFEAMIWDATNGMVGLGDLAGGSYFSEALDVSADGSVVVGRATGAAGQRAFVWDATNGMRELSTVLTGLGIDLTGWVLTDATAISADGLTITGYGRQGTTVRSFIAVIPEPGTALLMGLGLAGLASARKRPIA